MAQLSKYYFVNTLRKVIKLFKPESNLNQPISVQDEASILNRIFADFRSGWYWKLLGFGSFILFIYICCVVVNDREVSEAVDWSICNENNSNGGVVGYLRIWQVAIRFMWCIIWRANPRKRSIKNSFGTEMDLYEWSFCLMMSLHSKRDSYWLIIHDEGARW